MTRGSFLMGLRDIAVLSLPPPPPAEEPWNSSGVSHKKKVPLGVE